MTRVGFVPQNVPLIDAKSGRMTMDWYRYFTDLHNYSGLSGAQFPLYNSLFVPGSSMSPDGTNPPSLDVLGTNTRAWSFGASAAAYLHFSIQLPNGYVPGTNVTPFVQWAPSTTNTGTV